MALGFSVLRFRPFCRSVFRFLHQKSSVFWFLLRLAISVLFRSQFLVFGKNKIGFSDLLFGDAVWCFSGFSSEKMFLNDLTRGHVFSDFACGFRF